MLQEVLSVHWNLARQTSEALIPPPSSSFGELKKLLCGGLSGVTLATPQAFMLTHAESPESQCPSCPYLPGPSPSNQTGYQRQC